MVGQHGLGPRGKGILGRQGPQSSVRPAPDFLEVKWWAGSGWAGKEQPPHSGWECFWVVPVCGFGLFSAGRVIRRVWSASSHVLRQRTG